MKKAVVLLFVLIGAAAFAQNEIHKKVVDVFMMDFNNGDYEQIYRTFSPEMKNACTKKHYFSFFARVKKNQGKILNLELAGYLEKSGKTRGNYNGSFAFGNSSVRITTNAQGEIIGLYIKKNTLL